MKKILVIGRHASIMQKVLSMITSYGFIAKGVAENKEALDLFSKESFDAVIIGGGVDEPSRQLFYTEFRKQNPSIVIIDAHPQTIQQELEKLK